MGILRLLLIITTLTLAIGCKQTKSKNEMPPIRVEVTTATIDSLYSRINIASQIEGLHSATIQPRINGFLKSIHFDGGMPVKRGQLLFTVDPSTFATSLYAAQAALESARASEALAARNFERAEPLVQIDAISQSDFDQYRATYKSAMASTKSAEESLRSAELSIGYTKIFAPISGIAAEPSANVGDYIGPGTLLSSLTTITQLDTVSVEIPIPTAKYLQFASSSSFDNPNLLSQIELKLTDSTTYKYQGEYYYTIKNTPANTSTIVIVAKFPNPEFELKAGMFARIGANIGERIACTVIPKSAVSQLQGVNSVWVIMADSTAQWRKVTLGNTYGTLWDITSGIKAGERVVTSGGTKLHNGVKVAAHGSEIAR